MSQNHKLLPFTIHRIASELGVPSKYLDNFLDGFSRAMGQEQMVFETSKNLEGDQLKAYEAGYYVGKAQSIMIGKKATLPLNTNP